MKTILAAVDNSAASQPVLAMSLALAPMFGAGVEAVHSAGEAGSTARAIAERAGVPLRVVSGDPAERIIEMAASTDVVAVVVGTRSRVAGRRPAGHLALALADRLGTPIVVVPPHARPPERVRSVLVALKGKYTRARQLMWVGKLVADAGAELVVVHVDDESSIPWFCDQVQHETDAYADEFRARYLGGVPAGLELRIGVPADEIIAAADNLAPEILVLGWPQSHHPSGAVAREILDRTRIPVLLVPVF